MILIVSELYMNVEMQRGNLENQLNNLFYNFVIAAFSFVRLHSSCLIESKFNTYSCCCHGC